MFTQLAPDWSQRCHWYVYAGAGVPAQVPFAAVSVCPCVTVPEIVGTTELEGAIPAITTVCAEFAGVDPPAFVAVTTARIVASTSVPVST
ncbi:hypothetical protein, partial [Bradyrhizobium sp. NBAIM08]|uniref:hypothetical protein n=1 Tax=Bradyrhizobium sp. NBAIM08 TaxID=2793815 RepID=UPI001CD5DD46